MGVLHGDAGIDLELQFNYWTIKIQTCLTTWINTNVLLSIFIYTLFSFIFSCTVCIKLHYALLQLHIIFSLGGLMIAADLYMSW